MDLRALLPLDAHGMVSRADALAAGLDDADLRALRREQALVPLRRGIYVEAAVWQEADPFRAQPVLRIRAAEQVLRSDHVLSHDSAAIVLGLGVPDAQRALVHITRPKVHGDAVRAGIKHHLAPYADAQVVVVDGFRVLDRARTALDMAREHGLVAGVACCDAALRAGTTPDDLARAREAMFCWPQSRVMDAALDLADPGAESWLESEGRVFVTGLAIGRPQTQFGLTDGQRTVWCDLRVGRHVFEMDGWLKYLPDHVAGDPKAVLREEKRRQDFITGFKLGVSRITREDLRRPEQTRRRLLREYADTCGRFGTDITDLDEFRPQKPRRH
ncbi:type IV toxin-antitoxin system AbiEi family antitoxin domain-containing protein [Nocardioides mangrovi]|uniref:Type IV toxin-antitoxin system AbiEi family antitoxin domain-containing protein n=1 Tax=Nocardioides mangrovi TaxID=2874580 RepID=A0ABS7UJG7_9ACTN|nr:type IV toxin-antitoxin system AbiEi family antitoxin domain-containing protein [Nocardioides mangrovi]MBZ5741173.1 type IV toxin-antitoxin system AbiEi family antitoxin domain-containing protein [Nocardioides mangrovi]